MSEHLIWREQGKTIVGRVVVEGRQMRVERRNPIDDSYIAIGRYEDLKNPNDFETRDRKIQEFDSVFGEWSRAADVLERPSEIKANWHHGASTPLKHRHPNIDLSGVLVVNYGDREIAHIYKTKEKTGRWVSLSTQPDEG